MKTIRMILLGFAAAIFAMTLTVEPAAAQGCWNCGKADMLVDGEWEECSMCAGAYEGSQRCGTPSCTGKCKISGVCSVLLSFDGRSAGPEVPAPPNFEPLGGTEPVAVFASSARGGTPQTRRSCDGGIVSKWYSASAERAARGATSQLRL